MNPQEREQRQQEQEQACAQTFLDWLGAQRGMNHELQRAERVPELKGRWDFIARVQGRADWLAIEVKGIVLPESRRQFGDWAKFCSQVTKQGQGQIQGEFLVTTGIPWNFNQQESKELRVAFTQALAEVAPQLTSGEFTDLGPEIAKRFKDWPTEPPRVDMEAFKRGIRGKRMFIYLPKSLSVCKVENNGCLVELGASIPGAVTIDSALDIAVSSLLDAQGQKNAIANKQLGEAKRRGAAEAILLLDSHIRYKPNFIAHLLRCVDQAQLSNIDAVYLVSVSDKLVDKVWP